MEPIRVLRLDSSLYDYGVDNAESYVLRLEGSTLKAEWKWWPTTWLKCWLNNEEYRLPRIMDVINTLGKDCIVNSPQRVRKTFMEIVHSWRGYNPNRDPFDSSFDFSIDRYIDIEKFQLGVDLVVENFNNKNPHAKIASNKSIVEKTIALSKNLAEAYVKNPEKYKVRSFETPNSPDGLLCAEAYALSTAVRNNPLCLNGLKEMIASILTWAKTNKAREITRIDLGNLEQKIFQSLESLVDETKSVYEKVVIESVLSQWKTMLWLKALWEIEVEITNSMLLEWDSIMDKYSGTSKEFNEYMRGYHFSCPTRQECSLFVRERKIRPYNRGANLYLNLWNKKMPHILVSMDDRSGKLDDLNIIMNSTVDHRFRVYFVEKKKN